MIATFQRKLTADERRLLAEADATFQRNPANQRELLLGFVLLLCAAVCAGLLVLLIISKFPALLIGIGASVLILAGIVLVFFGGNMVSGWIHWRGVSKRRKADLSPAIRDALADGLVEVKRVTANEVIELEEWEDEGAGYIFGLGDGRSLFLKGQRYEPCGDSSVWPNTEFELVRTLKHRLWVGLFCHGEPLPPSQSVPLGQLPSDVVWADEERIFDAPPCALLERLRLQGMNIFN